MRLYRYLLLAVAPLAAWACGDGATTVETGSGSSGAGGHTGSGGESAQGGAGSSQGGAGGSSSTAQGGAGGSSSTAQGGAGGAVGAGGAGGGSTGAGGLGGAPSTSLFDVTMGSVADDTARGLAVDAAGDAIIAGTFNGDITLGGQTFTSVMIDSFVAKVDTSGAFVWQKHFGTAQNDRPVGVAVTPQGHILIAGSFGDFGGSWGGVPYNGTGPLFAELAPDGTNLWTKPWMLNGSGAWGGIAADPDGSTWVTGSFNGTVDFGAGVVASTGTLDVFAAHVDKTGALLDLDVKAGDVNVRGQAPDGKGGLYLSGTFKGSLDLGAGAMATADPMVAESFIGLLGPGGAGVWSKKLPGIVQRITADAAGNLFATGYFIGMVDFGKGPLTSKGADDAFVIKFDPAGAVVWAIQLGGSGSDGGRSIAVDPAGGIHVTGYFSGAPDFGMGPLTVGMGRNVLVVKLNASGQVLGAKGFGGDGADEGLWVATDSLANTFVFGEFDGSANFGSVLKNSTGLKDVFLLKAQF